MDSLRFRSGLLDPDTTIVDEEQTFWWNNLQENTLPPHSLVYSGNETARQLSVNSQMDSSQSSSKWWQNLEVSDNQHVASTRRNPSAAIVNTKILQTSTSESEKELERSLRKRKVRLKAGNNRKSYNTRSSSNNAFANALEDIEITPLKLQKQTNHSDFYSNSNREDSQNDEELSPTGKILKSKPSISKKRRSGNTENQNAFLDILTEDNVLNKPSKPANVEVHEVNNSRNDANGEYDSSIPKLSKSSPNKETRLTHNSLRNRSETPKPANIEVHEVIDNLSNDANGEHDLNVPKQLFKSSPGKKARNSLRNRSKTSKSMNIEVREVIDNSSNDANGEYDSSVPKQLSKSSPNKETRLTRNSLRNRSETPKPVNIEVPEVMDNSSNDANGEHDLNVPKRLFKSSLGKKVRNSLRNRSKTSKSVNIEVREVIDNLSNDANEKHDLSVPKRLFKSSPDKEARNNLRNQSETSKPANIEVYETIDNSSNDGNREDDSSIFKQLLIKSSPGKKAHLTRNSLKDRSETPKSVSKDMELPKQSINWAANVEEIDDVNADSEVNIDGASQIVSSTRISKANANTETHRSIILSTEMETTDDEDADPAKQTIQRNFTKVETSSKAVNQQSMQNSNRTIKDDRETARKQKSLSKSQNFRNTPIESSSKNISFNKQNSIKTLRKIDDFFKVKQASTMKQSNERAQKSQVFDNEKMEKVKTELEKIKNREMAAMKIVVIDKKQSALKTKNMKSIMPKEVTKKKPLANPTKVVDKAFLVNGKVYRAPRLPRPKYWVTNRLYKFLWNRLEPKYKLATRLKSEKFVQELAKVVSFIERRKNYKNYKIELEALMKEMARLNIINTRTDFYHFCQDFLPYEFRIKVIPMLLPDNKNNIPYDPEKLHIPLLDT